MLSLGHGLKLLSAARPRRNSRDPVCLSIQTSKRGKTRRCFCNSRAGGTTMAEEEEMMMSGGHSEMSSASHQRFPLDLRAEKDVSCSRRDSDGRFVNPWSTWDFPSYSKFFRFFLMDKNNSSVPSSKEVLDHELPIMEPFFVQRPDDCGKASLRVTWLGHATVLVELDGLVILTDPMFSQRASPVAFMGPKRYRDLPCTVEQIPRLDAVVISHNHYDHLDIASVLSLNSRFGSNLRWFVPLGLAGWMRNSGCENVVELDWWVGSCIPGHDEVAFFCTPAQHWCKRSALDENKALWSSWTIVGPNRRFFFAGDTGYCSVFQEIGRQFGPFDLAAIPIGAYLPRNIMKSQHVDPEEAVQIHKDVQAKSSIAIHWGTFALAHEHYLDPPIRLCEAMVHHMLNPERFFTLRHGESRVLNHEDMLS